MPQLEAVVRGTIHSDVLAMIVILTLVMPHLEILRWRPALRSAIPHQSTSDEVLEYNGKEYFIPAGSIVFGLPWYSVSSIV